MTAADEKAQLHGYLQRGREALLWKLDGLGEYDIRRPCTPTGTNLIGLVKHLASTELIYFGDTFGRPLGEKVPWLPDDLESLIIAEMSPDELIIDMWATADESRELITGFYRRISAHADTVIDALPLDAPGRVRWWGPEDRDVTLRRILIHMIAETDRHAGQADIVRELIDGAAGLNESNANLPDVDAAWWRAHVAKLEQAARAAERKAVEG
jgi:uncharacterized damage-inducible protein DinB